VNLSKQFERYYDIPCEDGKTSHQLQQLYRWEARSCKTYDSNENIRHYIEATKFQQT
jgi:hypothetical protein